MKRAGMRSYLQEVLFIPLGRGANTVLSIHARPKAEYLLGFSFFR